MMMNPNRKYWNELLIIGAILNFAIAILHLMIIFIGPRGYLYFGAADFATLATGGSLIPPIFTFILAIVFTVFGFYALSGTGIFFRLPFLRLGLVLIGCIYTLRGLIVIPDLIRLVNGAGYPFRQTVFSAVALFIGFVYLIGTGQQWNYLRSKIQVGQA